MPKRGQNHPYQIGKPPTSSQYPIATINQSPDQTSRLPSTDASPPPTHRTQPTLYSQPYIPQIPSQLTPSPQPLQADTRHFEVNTRYFQLDTRQLQLDNRLFQLDARHI